MVKTGAFVIGGIAAFTRAPHGRSSALSDGLCGVRWRSACPATARRIASAFGGSIVTAVLFNLPAWSIQTHPSAFNMISVTALSSRNGRIGRIASRRKACCRT